MKNVIIAVLLLLVLSNRLFAIEEGKPLPEFKLYATNLKPFTNENLIGSVNVLAFVPGAYTSVCTKEICDFRDNFDKYKELESNVIFVTTDAPFVNAAWAQANNISFPVVSDFSRNVIKDLGIYHENFANIEGFTVPKRSIIITDKDGKVAFKWISDNPSVLPPYEEIEKNVKKLNK